MAQTIIGIDIGSYAVKMCKFNRQFHNYELIDFVEQKISQNVRLNFEESTISSLRSLSDKHDLEADIISVSIPAQMLSFRVIELPFNNAKKIEQTIEFELESYIPLSLEDLVVDYHILSVEGQRSMVLVAYMPRLRFVKFLDMLQTVGIDPKYIGVDAIDLAHASFVSMVPQNAPYVILDIGHQKTNLCVMEGSTLRYVRSFSIGGLHFTRAIQKAFKLNYEKAEGLKLDRGKVSVTGEGLDQISKLCQEVAEELVVSIRQTHIGYMELYPDKDWMSIFLTGGGARLSGLSEMISNSLRINVATLDCLDYIPHKLGQPELHRDILCGAANEVLKIIFANRAIKINFRKGEFGYRKDFKALGSEFKQLGGWLVVIIIFAITHFIIDYQRLTHQISEVNSTLTTSAIKAMPELEDGKTNTVNNIIKQIDSKIFELEPQLEVFRKFIK